MVRITKSTFTAGIDDRHTIMLKTIESYMKKLEGIGGEITNTELLKWMIRVLWGLIITKTEEFKQLYQELKTKGIV